MKTSCIQHPAKTPLLIIRRWQVDATGDTCAAALLSYFEYWHNIKLEMREKAIQANRVAEMHGEEGKQDAGLYQFHTTEELKAGIMDLYSDRRIREAIELLESKGFINVSRNPNPKYRFDATRFFLLNTSKVQKAADASGQKDTSDGEKDIPCGKKAGRGGEKAAAIPETSSKITSKTPTRPATNARPLHEADRKKAEFETKKAASVAALLSRQTKESPPHRDFYQPDKYED